MLPSSLVEGLMIAKGRRIADFATFTFHFTILLNCSVFVAAGMIMILSIVSM